MIFFKELYSYDYKLLLFVLWIGGMVALQIYLKTKPPNINMDKPQPPMTLKKESQTVLMELSLAEKENIYISAL